MELITMNDKIEQIAINLERIKGTIKLAEIAANTLQTVNTNRAIKLLELAETYLSELPELDSISIEPASLVASLSIMDEFQWALDDSMSIIERSKRVKQEREVLSAVDTAMNTLISAVVDTRSILHELTSEYSLEAA